jgi:hypothetical protein
VVLDFVTTPVAPVVTSVTLVQCAGNGTGRAANGCTPGCTFTAVDNSANQRTNSRAFQAFPDHRSCIRVVYRKYK